MDSNCPNVDGFTVILSFLSMLPIKEPAIRGDPRKVAEAGFTMVALALPSKHIDRDPKSAGRLLDVALCTVARSEICPVRSLCAQKAVGKSGGCGSALVNSPVWSIQQRRTTALRTFQPVTRFGVSGWLSFDTKFADEPGFALVV